jgi:hypothetical protein
VHVLPEELARRGQGQGDGGAIDRDVLEPAGGDEMLELPWVVEGEDGVHEAGDLGLEVVAERVGEARERDAARPRGSSSWVEAARAF